jgi:predicted acetyltransferase
VTSSSLAVRTATSDDYDEATRCFAAAMLFEPTVNLADRALFEPERALIVTDADDVVGTARAYTRTLSVPGNVVDAAHVTGVGVTGTHRRRGIFSRLMRRQLEDLPEAIAVLWASEPGIYGRYGYGAAAWQTRLHADLALAKPLPFTDPGRLRELSAKAAMPVLARLHTRYQAQRAGVSGRAAGHWEMRLDDPPTKRDGATARRIVVHYSANGEPDGYALWRAKPSSDNSGPACEVMVEELVAVDPAGYQALWQHLLTVDLARTLRFTYAAVDEPVRELVVNPRALGAVLRDTLWLRITDVVRALEQRRYATAVDVVLDITDELILGNAGRFHLSGDRDKAICRPTTDTADLSLSIADLGAAYLGGWSLTQGVALGRVVEHTPGVLTATATAFSWPTAPNSIEIF